MAKTPTNAPKTTPAKMGAAAPKSAPAATATPSDKATDEAAAAAAAAELKKGEASPPEAYTAEQIQALKDEAFAAGVASIDTAATKEAAYKDGYSEGFSAALDEGTAGAGADLDNQPGAATSTAFYGAQDHERADLISLALFTPENQRKGGLFVVVNRLQSFIDGLAPDDRYPALRFMAVIAQTTPMDLASGRFKNVTLEAIDALKGEGIATLSAQESANASADALARMQEAAPDLDNKPENLVDEEGEGLPDDVDINDPDSSEAAAARLAGV